MTLLKLARMGHPVLRHPARSVDDPTAPEIRGLAADMLETMLDAGGTGIAAPQVHVPLRVVMFRIGADRAACEGMEALPLTILVNPEIEVLDSRRELGWEGCLSVPGLRGAVPRHLGIRYRGTTPDGERVERVAHGFHARVVQHECDHLDGILYPARMTDLSLLAYVEEWPRELAGLDLSALPVEPEEMASAETRPRYRDAAEQQGTHHGKR